MALVDPPGPGAPRTGGEHLPRLAHAAGLVARLSGNPVAQGRHAVPCRPPSLPRHRTGPEPQGRRSGAVVAGTGAAGTRLRAAGAGAFFPDRPGPGHLPEIRTHRRSAPGRTQGQVRAKRLGGLRGSRLDRTGADQPVRQCPAPYTARWRHRTGPAPARFIHRSHGQRHRPGHCPGAARRFVPAPVQYRRRTA
ncbi:hypothetical protein D3C73_938880 [compost metagenome]